MTCIGNSGDLLPEVSKPSLQVTALLLLFCPETETSKLEFILLIKANYLASPALVIAYAIAGRMDLDFEKEPIAKRMLKAKDVFLKDIGQQELKSNKLSPSA